MAASFVHRRNPEEFYGKKRKRVASGGGTWYAEAAGRRREKCSVKKTLGIIGGMGPLATADLFRKIIEETAAERDQDHIHLLIDNNTDIPDRTAALLDGAESPLPEMVKSAKWLEQAGAEGLLMPCNTAHGFYEALRVSVSGAGAQYDRADGRGIDQTRRDLRRAAGDHRAPSAPVYIRNISGTSGF